MKNIKWSDRVRKEEVIGRVGEERNIEKYYKKERIIDKAYLKKRSCNEKFDGG